MKQLFPTQDYRSISTLTQNAQDCLDSMDTNDVNSILNHLHQFQLTFRQMAYLLSVLRDVTAFDACRKVVIMLALGWTREPWDSKNDTTPHECHKVLRRLDELKFGFHDLIDLFQNVPNVPPNLPLPIGHSSLFQFFLVLECAKICFVALRPSRSISWAPTSDYRSVRTLALTCVECLQSVKDVNEDGDAWTLANAGLSLKRLGYILSLVVRLDPNIEQDQVSAVLDALGYCPQCIFNPLEDESGTTEGSDVILDRLRNMNLRLVDFLSFFPELPADWGQEPLPVGSTLCSVALVLHVLSPC